MLTAGIFTGLACGALLAATGLTLWDSFRPAPGIFRAVRVIGWLASLFLLTGALLAWPGDRGLSTPALRLTLMAALAAPQITRRRRNSHWSDVMLILPSLALTGGGIFCSLGTVEIEAGRLPSASVELALLICGGLGARALGEAMSACRSGRSFIAAYVLLTLLVGELALVNLWQRGVVWGSAPGAGGLAGAWLVWSAAWLWPRRHPRLRAGLTAVAALLLIVITLV
ncbi:MAG: hypothetical protein DRI77_10315 [Chloroflexi bacterium]|nr:MAG: hypothetical protein DRI77_10315 [Chloroflexota bacterium]